MEGPRISSALHSKPHLDSGRNADFNFNVSDILGDYFTKKFDKDIRRGDVDRQKYFKMNPSGNTEDRKKSVRRRKKHRQKHGRRDCNQYEEASFRHIEKRPRHEPEWSYRGCRGDDDRIHRSRRSRSADRRRDRSRNSKGDCSRPLTNLDEHLSLNKSELFEVARRNVKQMLHDGTLPKGVSVDPQKLGLSRTHNRDSIEMYTETCRKIQKEAENERYSPQLNHPFIVDEKSNKINITDPISTPLKTSQDNLSAQFPVSSGSSHRELECDLDETETYKRTPKESSELFGRTNQIFGQGRHDKTSSYLHRPRYHEIDSRQLANVQCSRGKERVRKLPSHLLTAGIKEEPKYNELMLNECRFDSARPGQLTDCADPNVRFLSANELRHGPQAWTRKDQLKKTKALSGGIGMTLLQKMGWEPGTALGKNREGVLEPLLVDVKFDRKGLVAQEERVKKTSGNVTSSTANRSASETAAMQKIIEKEFAGKHPVTLILEICTARKLYPPKFIDLPPEGEPHDRTFLCRVDLNGKVFIPTERSLTKKLAKAQAALLALAALRENDASKYW